MGRMSHPSKMPLTCPMTKKTRSGQGVEACSCSVSPQAPPLIENPNHITLAFEDYSAPAMILTASPFYFRFSATPLEGSAPAPDHPPRLLA